MKFNLFLLFALVAMMVALVNGSPFHRKTTPKPEEDDDERVNIRYNEVMHWPHSK